MLRGQLTFNESGKYGLFNKGEYIELEEELNRYLMDDLHIKISTVKGKGNSETEEVVYDKQGFFKKDNDLGGKLYRYFIGEDCLDDFLWEISNLNITIKIDVDIVKVNYYNNLDSLRL